MSKFTEEQIDYLRKIAPGRFLPEITEKFNEHFGTDFPVNTIRNKKKDLKIRSNIKNRCPEGCKKGWFKKGHSVNIMKTWTISQRIYKGNRKYWFIKTPKGWVGYQRFLYETLHGKAADGEVVIFIDGNPNNCCEDNLTKLSRSEITIYNNMGGHNGEWNLARINVARIIRKLYDQGERGLTHYDSRTRKCDDNNTGATQGQGTSEA